MHRIADVARESIRTEQVMTVEDATVHKAQAEMRIRIARSARHIARGKPIISASTKDKSMEIRVVVVTSLRIYIVTSLSNSNITKLRISLSSKG